MLRVLELLADTDIASLRGRRLDADDREVGKLAATPIATISANAPGLRVVVCIFEKWRHHV
jgi:hypothetical protein